MEKRRARGVSAWQRDAGFPAEELDGAAVAEAQIQPGDLSSPTRKENELYGHRPNLLRPKAPGPYPRARNSRNRPTRRRIGLRSDAEKTLSCRRRSIQVPFCLHNRTDWWHANFLSFRRYRNCLGPVLRSWR